MILDIFSRKIVDWKVWEEEKCEYAAKLVEGAVILERVRNNPLILHSDNGVYEGRSIENEA